MGAWQEIKAKIHYTYENLDAALFALEEVAPFLAPSGFGGSGKIPNVQETSNPAKILTVEFEKGRIRWPDLRLLDMEVDG